LRTPVIRLEEIEGQDYAATTTDDFDVHTVNLETRRFIWLLPSGF
jgi:hypothetical protein